MNGEILELVKNYKKLAHESRSIRLKISKFNSISDNSAVIGFLGEIDTILAEMMIINKTIIDKLNNPDLYTLYFQLQYNIENEKFEECVDITKKINDIEKVNITTF